MSDSMLHRESSLLSQNQSWLAFGTECELVAVPDTAVRGNVLTGKRKHDERRGTEAYWRRTAETLGGAEKGSTPSRVLRRARRKSGRAEWEFREQVSHVFPSRTVLPLLSVSASGNT